MAHLIVAVTQSQENAINVARYDHVLMLPVIAHHADATALGGWTSDVLDLIGRWGRAIPIHVRVQAK